MYILVNSAYLCTNQKRPLLFLQVGKLLHTELPSFRWIKWRMSSGFVDEWIADGLLLNIQEYIDRDIMPNADDYFTGLLDVARAPDKTTGDAHAFPFAFVETVLYYSQDAFDEAGVAYPDEAGWTWDEFLAIAQALTIDEGDGGLVDQYGFWFYGLHEKDESGLKQFSLASFLG